MYVCVCVVSSGESSIISLAEREKIGIILKLEQGMQMVSGEDCKAIKESESSS